MTALTLLVILAAAPQPLKLASNGFAPLNVDARTADFFDEYFSQQLQAAGVPVTTRSAVQALIGLERQKELLGCSTESTSCLAELAGALGVDGILVGNVARFGTEYTVTVKLVSAKDARTLFSESGRVENERLLLDWLGRTARKMAQVAGAAPTPEPPAAVAAAPPPTSSPRSPAERRRGAWIATGVAGGLLVATVASYAGAQTAYRELTDSSGRLTAYSDVRSTRERGELLQVLAGVLGVATLGASGYAGWSFLSAGGQPAVGVHVGGGGAAVVFSGRFQ